MNEALPLEEAFKLADADIRINTAYPLAPDWFSEYRTLEDLFAGVHGLSYYVHVPFCPTLCSYCEYTRFKSGDDSVEVHYLDLLEHQCRAFMGTHDIREVRGFDVGGGTPTALSSANFRRLMCVARELLSEVKRDERFESSIEFSFDTITEEKISALVDAGFKRVSAGLQSVGTWFETGYGRCCPSIERMEDVHRLLSRHGVAKMNLDVMYGFDGQTLSSVRDTISAIARIAPEQVTVYEVRYNMNGLSHVRVSRDGNYDFYRALYEGLSQIGYRARFGQNAFTRVEGPAVSSYISSRMDDAFPYKGLGVAAQSMNDVGISYNSLKGVRSVNMPKLDVIREQDVYKLSGDELAAKYISVALYGGSLKLSTVSRLLGRDAGETFAEELSYLSSGGLINLKPNGDVVLTENGVRFSGAIGAMFWPKRHWVGFQC